MAERFDEDALHAVGVRIDAEHPEGIIFDPHQPQLRVTDLSAVRGDGIFETMLAVEGHVRKFTAHLQRLQRSAQITEIPLPPDSSWRAAVDLGLDEFRTRGGLPDELAVRITASRGVDGEPASDDPAFSGTYWVLLTPVSSKVKDSRGRPISVTLLDRGYDSTAPQRAPWLLLGAKTLSYAVNMAALRWAAAHGHDDVVFTSSDDLVLEGPVSSLLLGHRTADGQVHLKTPSAEAGILPGTTQATIFRAAEQAGWQTSSGPVTVAELHAAEFLWLTGSVKLVSPIARIDDHEVRVDAELTNSLLDFLSQEG
ncbi:aminotransferase class IV [Nesterenkonia sphaerica]|uniref:Aminodeoxychorismate lyase n=1 Tax=Nesterenkonia sphaerica TaxID=1804988 RepID=A0A5R9AMC7_9MICC|nr:aminotransferase class IV [Nesterenkonia sphaerica]TLP79016.1 aminodeoxychorismate lyase [Nesterenkonia sphaerica]